MNCPYPQNRNDLYDITVINRPSTGDHNFADIVGKDLTIKFRYPGVTPDTIRNIAFGQKQGGGTGDANGIKIINGTPNPILINEHGSDITGASRSPITDDGKDNNIDYYPYDFSKRE